MDPSAELSFALTRLCLAYPNFVFDKPVIGIYVEMLSDIPASIVLAAAQEHISRKAFFPTISELREAAFGLIEAAQQLPDPYQAWAEVKQAMKQVGHKGSPAFSHPLIGQVVDLFGWVDLCQSDNVVADRSHFVEAYQRRLASFQNEQRRLPDVQQALLAYRTTNPLLPPGD